MGSANKIFSGVAWSVVVNVVNGVYGFVATPLLIGHFGRSEYGIIALAGSINAYMGLMDMGLGSTNVRYFSNWLAKGDNEKVRKLMQTCTAFYSVVGLINAVVLLTVYGFTDTLFNLTSQQDVILKQILLVLSITAVINWYTSCFGQIISATENVAWIQKRTLITKCLMIIAVLLTLYYKFSLFQYFISTTIANLLVLPLTIRKIHKDLPFISFVAKFDKTIFLEILPYSLSLFSFGIFQFSYYNLRTVILGIQGCVDYVTDYGVMGSLAGLASMVSSVFIGALLPTSSRVVAKGDKEAFDKVVYQGTRYISIVLCFCSFGLITISKDLIKIYVGDNFFHLIPWLNLWLVAIISNHNAAISSLILAGTKLKALSYTSAFSATIGLISCWYLVPKYEAGGVVLSYFIYCTLQILFFYLYYWPIKMGINSWKVFKQSLLPYFSLGVMLVLILDHLPHYTNSWINIFVFGSCYAILFIFITAFITTKDDRTFILKLVKK